MPTRPRPIVVIGAGGIVRDAHLPAYRKWGLPVAGIFDVDRGRAEDLAAAFAIPTVFDSLDAALAVDPSRVFDVALPPQALADVLPRVPQGGVALIQKPLGMSHGEARTLAGNLMAREVTAAVNFQMQFTPAMMAIGEALTTGLLGDPVDIEVRVQCKTPWEDWPFMTGLDHIELPLHSIHYLDWIRAHVGMPRAAFALSLPHPDYPDRADARSSIVLDYGDRLRCCLSLNHVHKGGPDHESAEFRVEGNGGTAIADMGYLIDQPAGVPERLRMNLGEGWRDIPLAGARGPDSFAFVMANLQRFAAGEDDTLVTGLEPSVATMALVDACMQSSDRREVIAIPEI